MTKFFFFPFFLSLSFSFFSHILWRSGSHLFSPLKARERKFRFPFFIIPEKKKREKDSSAPQFHPLTFFLVRQCRVICWTPDMFIYHCYIWLSAVGFCVCCKIYRLPKASYTWSQKSAQIPQIWVQFDSKPTILTQICGIRTLFWLHVYEALASMLTLRLDCSSAALNQPQKLLSHWKLVEIEMLDFSGRARTGIFISISVTMMIDLWETLTEMSPSLDISGPWGKSLAGLGEWWPSLLGTAQYARRVHPGRSGRLISILGHEMSLKKSFLSGDQHLFKWWNCLENFIGAEALTTWTWIDEL